jgi:hypothetical protein
LTWVDAHGLTHVGLSDHGDQHSRLINVNWMIQIAFMCCGMETA